MAAVISTMVRKDVRHFIELVPVWAVVRHFIGVFLVWEVVVSGLWGYETITRRGVRPRCRYG